MDPTQPLLPLDEQPHPAPHPPQPASAPSPPPTIQAPMLLTVRDVEAELQLGRTRTYELVRSGELPVIRLGRIVRIPRDALERWVADHQSGQAGR